MADYTAICQLLYRYCAAHDNQDAEALGQTFAKDITMPFGQGRDAVVEFYANGYKSLTKQRRHVLSNIFIVEDGEEEALVQSYITLYLIEGDKLELHLTGVYRDRVVLEDGEWKIAARDAAMDVPYNPGDVNMASLPTNR
jgi:3-phenylpropionate/cinnamic acid dioxygenase small subunit